MIVWDTVPNTVHTLRGGSRNFRTVVKFFLADIRGGFYSLSVGVVALLVFCCSHSRRDCIVTIL
jgi:hypothetical protein